MKREYEKPGLTSEAALEALAAGCTLQSAGDDENCDPDANPGVNFELMSL